MSCIRTYSRLERTSDGRGRVSAATLDELERLDFGSWHKATQHADYPHTQSPLTQSPLIQSPLIQSPLTKSPHTARVGRRSLTGRRYWRRRRDIDVVLPVAVPDDEPGQDDAVARVLTLDRLLAAVVGAGRPLRLLIETKHPTRFGAEVEQRVIELLHRFGLADGGAQSPVRVTVMSFSPLAVRRIHQLAPGLETVFLYEYAPHGVREGRAPFGGSILGPSLAALRSRPEMVRRAHALGNRVYVWTVNTTVDVDFVHGLGVDGIISDHPAMVLGRLGRAQRA